MYLIVAHPFNTLLLNDSERYQTVKPIIVGVFHQLLVYVLRSSVFSHFYRLEGAARFKIALWQRIDDTCAASLPDAVSETIFRPTASQLPAWYRPSISIKISAETLFGYNQYTQPEPLNIKPALNPARPATHRTHSMPNLEPQWHIKTSQLPPSPSEPASLQRNQAQPR